MDTFRGLQNKGVSMLLNGWIGKYYIEIDPTTNATQGRVINIENGDSIEANFTIGLEIFKDLKEKYPVIIEVKDTTIAEKQAEINFLNTKISFLESKMSLSIADYDKYKTL